VDQIKLLNFADYFLFSGSEDIEELKEELFEAGISSEDNQDKIFNYLRQQRAEILLETGRRFKEKYLKLISENTIKDSENEFANSDLVLAYRRKIGEKDDTEDEAAKKLEMIRKSKETE